MRTTAAALIAITAAVVLGACGSAKAPRTQGPSEATFTVKTTAVGVSRPACPKASKAVIGGARDVRVAGLDGRPVRQPRRLVVAREVTMSCLAWRAWGRGTARALGVAERLDCIPNCAAGEITRLRGELTLSGLKRCRGRRFYSRASVALGPADSAQRLRAFVVVPCTQTAP